MINVVNVYTHKPTAFDFKISRPSVLGNPFTHIKNGKTLAKFVVEDRDAACDSYDGYIMERLKNDDQVIIAELNKIVAIEKEYGSVNLICYCAPKRCHGHVIKRIIENRNVDYPV